MALNTTASLLSDASKEMQTESSYTNFKVAVLANIKTVEALLFLDQENEELLVTALKGYAGYSFVVNETEYLEEYYSKKEKEVGGSKEQLISNYSKSLNYGMRFLKVRGIQFNQLQDSLKETDGMDQLLTKKLDGESMLHLEGVMYLAQSLGGLINVQKNDMRLVYYAPVAKGLFDWVCKNKPDMVFGSCNLFYGAYEAGRPKMLGGNPQLAQKYFEEMIAKYPHNWLARLGYIQYYLIPLSNEEEYKQQAKFLDQALLLHQAQLKWNPVVEPQAQEAFAENQIRLFQTVAIERYKIIKKYEKELF